MSILLIGLVDLLHKESLLALPLEAMSTLIAIEGVTNTLQNRFVCDLLEDGGSLEVVKSYVLSLQKGYVLGAH